LENTRQEWGSGLVQSFVNGSGEASQGLTISHALLTPIEYYPSCSIIENTAGGSLVTDHNQFIGAQPENQSESVCPNGFVTFTAPQSGWDSRSDYSDNIGRQTTQPLSAYPNALLAGGTPWGSAEQTISPANINAVLPWYFTRDVGEGGIFQINVQPSAGAPLTSLTLQGPCPFTVSSLTGTTQKTFCSITGPPTGAVVGGGSVIFPYQIGTADLYGSLEANVNGQSLCEWRIASDHLMASGQIQIDTMHKAPSSFNACSATCGNPGSLNLCFNAGSGFKLENNVATEGMHVTINNGVY
jgi:hypothetical protein